MSRNPEINYFDWIYNLRQLRYDLSKIKNYEEARMYTSKVMAYICAEKDLYTIFNNKLEQVVKSIEEPKSFEVEYLKLEQKIKSVINNYTRSRFDIPLIYLFPSITEDSNINNKKCFSISKNLHSMYTKFNRKLNYINIPENTEFYILVFFSYNQVFETIKDNYIETNIVAYLSTVMNFVITYLLNNIHNIIEKKYLSKYRLNLKFADYEKQKHYLSYKDGILYLDKEVLDINKNTKQFQILNGIFEFEPDLYSQQKHAQDFSKYKNHKKSVEIINKKAKKCIGKNILRSKNGIIERTNHVIFYNPES